MPFVGAGCMGFVNVARGLRALGYVEREVLQPGPIALLTHSGSAFSALLRTHRRLEYSLAVSSGQELVTTTADYLDYALSLPETRVVGLFLETMRDVPRLRDGLARAAELDVPVVALAVGATAAGSVAGRGALRCGGRGGRCLGGVVPRVRRAPGARPRRARRHARGDEPAARASTAARHAASRPCTTPAGSGCSPPTSPRRSAVPFAPLAEPTRSPA